MEYKSKLNKYSQIAKLCIMVLLLLITPFLSLWMRTPYFYFLLNLLIIVVGAEAGILRSSSSSTYPEDKMHQPVVVVVVPPPKSITTSTKTNSPTTSLGETTPNKEITAAVIIINKDVQIRLPVEFGHRRTTETKVLLRKCVSEKLAKVVKVVGTIKRSPTTPSLFFIGDGDVEQVEDVSLKVILEKNLEEVVEEVDVIGGQELFTKAEMFIGNFYSQLKIQRENSRKRLHYDFDL